MIVGVFWRVVVVGGGVSGGCRQWACGMAREEARRVRDGGGSDGGVCEGEMSSVSDCDIKNGGGGGEVM